MHFANAVVIIMSRITLAFQTHLYDFYYAIMNCANS